MFCFVSSVVSSVKNGFTEAASFSSFCQPSFTGLVHDVVHFWLDLLEAGLYVFCQAIES